MGKKMTAEERVRLQLIRQQEVAISRHFDALIKEAKRKEAQQKDVK